MLEVVNAPSSPNVLQLYIVGPSSGFNKELGSASRGIRALVSSIHPWDIGMAPKKNRKQAPETRSEEPVEDLVAPIGYIQMALFPRTPKLESRNCPGLESRDCGRS
jgi:hypothetical protein